MWWRPERPVVADDDMSVPGGPGMMPDETVADVTRDLANHPAASPLGWATGAGAVRHARVGTDPIRRPGIACATGTCRWQARTALNACAPRHASAGSIRRMVVRSPAAPRPVAAPDPDDPIDASD